MLIFKIPFTPSYLELWGYKDQLYVQKSIAPDKVVWVNIFQFLHENMLFAFALVMIINP